MFDFDFLTSYKIQECPKSFKKSNSVRAFRENCDLLIIFIGPKRKLFSCSKVPRILDKISISNFEPPYRVSIHNCN